MNYSQLLNKLDTLVHDTHITASEFTQSIGKSKAYWSMVQSGKRRLTIDSPEMQAICNALGIELSVVVNGTIDYQITEIHKLGNGINTGLKVCRSNYQGLWAEFSELNQLEDCEIPIDILRDYIGDIRNDGTYIPDWDNDIEMLKRAFYRYIREFENQDLSTINGNRFPVESLQQYDTERLLDWNLTGRYCHREKAETVPF